MLDWIVDTHLTLSAGGYPVYVGLNSEYTANIIRWIYSMLDQIENTQQTLSGGYPVFWTRYRIHSNHYQVDIHYVGQDIEYKANIIRWISSMLDQIENTQQTLASGYLVLWTEQWIHSKHYQVYIQYVKLDIGYKAKSAGGYTVSWTGQWIHI